MSRRGCSYSWAASDTHLVSLPYHPSSFYGQTKPEKKDLEALSSTLDIPYAELEEYLGPNYVPHRGLCEMPPRGESCSSRDKDQHQLFEIRSWWSRTRNWFLADLASPLPCPFALQTLSSIDFTKPSWSTVTPSST